MLSVEEAVSALVSAARPVDQYEQVSIAEGLGRVLARDVTAGIDVPPADNSAMDGYAFCHADWNAAETPLEVSQRIPAGIRPEALQPGTAARIFTGAEIPEGADTVVMQEHCSAQDGVVHIERCPSLGANVRPRAQDIQAGDTVLRAGKRLSPQALGLLASLGHAHCLVFRKLRVGVVSNGSELVEPGEAVKPGQIYNSNRYLLAGLVNGWGFDLVDYGIATDCPDEIRNLLQRAAQEVDVIVSSGGVSVGEEDHIKQVVSDLGMIDLWKVSIKPGKPFAFGKVADTPFLGLPGNPASVLVTALVIARPYLLSLQGQKHVHVQPARHVAQFSLEGGPRAVYLRAKTTPDGVECHPRQSSGMLTSAVWGDGLVVQAPEQNIQKGDLADFLPYSSLT